VSPPFFSSLEEIVWFTGDLLFSRDYGSRSISFFSLEYFGSPAAAQDRGDEAHSFLLLNCGGEEVIEFFLFAM